MTARLTFVCDGCGLVVDGVVPGSTVSHECPGRGRRHTDLRPVRRDTGTNNSNEQTARSNEQ